MAILYSHESQLKIRTLFKEIPLAGQLIRTYRMIQARSFKRLRHSWTWSLRWRKAGSLQSFHGLNKSSRSILCPLSALALHFEILPLSVFRLLPIEIGFWNEISGGSDVSSLMEALWNIIFSWDFNYPPFCQRFLPLPNSKEINVQSINIGE